MSHWNGRMGKGYARQVRELKREEAKGRIAENEARVQVVMREQNVTRGQAVPVVHAERRLNQRKAALRAARAS